MTTINGLADLRPGDIMFGPIGGAVGLGIGLGQLALGEGFHVGKLSIRHVGIVVEAATMAGAETIRSARLVQAMPRGAEEVPMRDEYAYGHGPSFWTPEHAYVRLPEDYPGQARDAAAIARLMVAEHVAYSFASYAALAAWRWGLKAGRLGKWIERRRPLDPLDWPYGPPERLPSGRPWDQQLPVEAICSVLVDQAWSLAGKRVMRNVAHQAVTPGAMAGQLLTRPGAIWGGPAWG